MNRGKSLGQGTAEGAAPGAEIEALRLAQVEQLYRNAPLGMVATAVNSLILAYVVAGWVPGAALGGWLACLWSLTLIRYLDVRGFRREAPGTRPARLWEARFTVGIGLAGAVWGSAGLFLFSPNSLLHQIFVTFVLGGMVAGAAGAFSARLGSFLFFSIPALTPVALRFLTGGAGIPVAMGVMVLLFGVLVTATAVRVQRTILASLRMRFENEGLIAFLESEKAHTEAANRELAAEIAERERTERELARHRDHLKELVAERTAEVEAACRDLEQDIAERRRTEEALRTSESRFRRLVENATDAFFLHDLSGRLVDVNEQACRSLGYSREELLRLGVADFSAKYDATKVCRMMEGVRAEAPRSLEDVHRRKDGSSFPVEVRVSAVREAGGLLCLCLARDIADRKQAEEALRAAKEAAEEASRAKSEFLANMSHEIRTPMNGVLGMIELVLRRPLPPEEQEYLRVAARSGRALLRILDEILDFSRIEAGRLEVKELEFDLRNEVEEVVSIFAVDAHSKGLELVCHVDPSVPARIVGDPGRLGQVLVNLIGNAVKFTEKGEVVVRVESLIPEASEGAAGGLRVSVRDTGIGVPEDKLGVIFESFRQVDGSSSRQHGGTGLGLAISKRIVERMGGSIWAVSRPGAGSTFSFQVPVPAAPPGARVRKGAPAGGERFPALVVDDNESSREALRDLLSSLGAAADLAATGEEAEGLMRERTGTAPPYALVLLDSRLGEADGFAVAENLRRGRYAGVHIAVMVPSHDPAGGLSQCLQKGLPSCLVKPVREADLRRVLAELPGWAGETLRRERSEAARPQAGKPGASPGRRGRGVLLAEDDPTNRLFLSAVLQNAGYTVTAVPNGRAALQAVGEGHFGLVIMDVQMPEMDGIEAVRAIRAMEAESGDHIPILGLSAHALVRDRDRCLEAGMDDYLSKPIDPDQLTTAVERLAASDH